MDHPEQETPLQKRIEGRIIAIDYGHARIGLAISDVFGITGHALETIPGDKIAERASKKIRNAIEKIEKEKSYIIDTIVLGLPLNMNGSESERSKEVRRIHECITTLLPTKTILLFDERLTSKQAERSMKETGHLNRKDRSKKVDAVAALLLLQSYLDSKLFNKKII